MAGDVIAGRYRLLEQLGKGAMAAVWLAEDTELERQVAVKILWPEADRERFGREARAVAALSHPNVCRLYDFGETEHGPFMVLEVLSGGSLDDRLARGQPLSEDETRRIAEEIAAGLAHAHEHGLVHRDLKPGNILFDDEGRAKIADFGIVRLADTSAITETGTVLGTAAYISPEQMSGGTATPASDVYAFGAILFQMLTGRLPFESSSAVDLVRRHRSEPAPPVSQYRSDAPADLARLAGSALAKAPRERPADGTALLAALAGRNRFPTAAESATTLVVPPRRGRGRAVRTFILIAAVTTLAVGGLALAFISTRGGSGGSATIPLPPSTSSSTAETTQASVPVTTANTSSEEQTTSTQATLPTLPTITTPRTTTATTAPGTTAPTTTEPTTTEPPPTTEPTTTTPGTTAPTGTVTP